MGKLDGKTAIITGSASGIGRAIAIALADEGANVVVADLQSRALVDKRNEFTTTTVDAIKAKGGKAIFVKVNVKEEQEVEEMVAAAVKEFGRLDIMVNNAGIAMDVVGLSEIPGGIRLHETPTETFDNTIAINTRGVFLGCKYAIPQFLKQDPQPENNRGDRVRGWIINTASVAGLISLIGAPSYVTSKHAVVGLTKQVAVDYAKDKILCNAICPSFVKTPLLGGLIDEDNEIGTATMNALTAAHPWGALGQPSDVAGIAVFLASDAAEWITGSALVVDGGYTAQ